MFSTQLRCGDEGVRPNDINGLMGVTGLVTTTLPRASAMSIVKVRPRALEGIIPLLHIMITTGSGTGYE